MEPNGRRRGVRQLLIGLSLFLPGLLVFTVARGWLLDTFGTTRGDQVVVELPRAIALIIGGPMAIGYVFVMFGLYRVLFGERGRAQTFLWSMFRIVFGLIVTIGLIVVLALAFAALRRRPKGMDETTTPPTSPESTRVRRSVTGSRLARTSTSSWPEPARARSRSGR